MSHSGNPFKTSCGYKTYHKKERKHKPKCLRQKFDPKHCEKEYVCYRKEYTCIECLKSKEIRTCDLEVKDELFVRKNPLREIPNQTIGGSGQALGPLVQGPTAPYPVVPNVPILTMSLPLSVVAPDEEFVIPAQTSRQSLVYFSPTVHDVSGVNQTVYASVTITIEIEGQPDLVLVRQLGLNDLPANSSQTHTLNHFVSIENTTTKNWFVKTIVLSLFSSLYLAPAPPAPPPPPPATFEVLLEATKTDFIIAPQLSYATIRPVDPDQF